MKMLAVVIPMLSFIVLLRKEDFREHFLMSAIINGIFIALSTEILSLFKAVAYFPLLACWSAYTLALLVWRIRRKGVELNFGSTELTLFQKVMLVSLTCIIGITGITAVVAAPNNFDSLTYHLPRILHWIQNGSVEHYPTHIDRQLVLAPWSEFAIMHLQILSGGDYLSNSVQWLSMLGSAIGVSLITKKLQGSVNSQIIAAIVAVTVPIGILEATSTQNDYTVTFWLICLSYYVIKAKTCTETKNTLLLGMSLALAIFTKGTAYLIAFPFMLVYLWRLAATGIRPATRNLLTVIAVVLLVNGGHFSRNYTVYGNPLSPGTGNDIICKRFDVAAAISCVTKNLVTELSSRLPSANAALNSLTNFVHRTIGIDVNDRDLTAHIDFVIFLSRNNEDFASNPLHMILMLLGTFTLVWHRKKFSRDVTLYSLAIMLSFITLSIGIKWNPFISRYFLPVFVMSAPFIGIVFDGGKIQYFANSCAIGLIALSLTILATNEMRPLVGEKSIFLTSRIDQYFMVNPTAKPYFIAQADRIMRSGVRNVGIVDRNQNMWEYLVWILLQNNDATYRIEHIGVKNNSGKIKLNDFTTYISVTI